MTQTVIVIAIVTLAATYLAWQFYRRFCSRSDKCGSCAAGKLAKD